MAIWKVLLLEGEGEARGSEDGIEHVEAMVREEGPHLA